jgi:hypothetical protein
MMVLSVMASAMMLAAAAKDGWRRAESSLAR